MKALTDIGYILLQVVGYTVLIYFIGPIFGAMMGGSMEPNWMGASVGMICGLSLALVMFPDWRRPWKRMWQILTSPFRFDIEIDTARKITKKDSLKDNPLDD